MKEYNITCKKIIKSNVFLNTEYTTWFKIPNLKFDFSIVIGKQGKIGTFDLK